MGGVVCPVFSARPAIRQTVSHAAGWVGAHAKIVCPSRVAAMCHNTDPLGVLEADCPTAQPSRRITRWQRLTVVALGRDTPESPIMDQPPSERYSPRGSMPWTGGESFLGGRRSRRSRGWRRRSSHRPCHTPFHVACIWCKSIRLDGEGATGKNDEHGMFAQIEKCKVKSAKCKIGVTLLTLHFSFCTFHFLLHGRLVVCFSGYTEAWKSSG